MTDLSRLDAVAQASLVSRGELSALELVDAAIRRIEALEPSIHALASHDFTAARARAAQKPSGPLAGVPFLLKDLLPYPGQRCAMGSRLFRSNMAREGSPYTERLDAAGLITLGKSTTSEFGLLGSTETLLEGVTHNPWDLTRSATGSSGGAAAAVASGMVPLAHASDGGGSIRIPAAACGLFGFMPGRGRLVSTGQALPFDLLRDHCVSRSVRDSALLLSLTEEVGGKAGPPVGYVDRPLARRLRIGFYSRTIMGDAPDPEVAKALERTIALCTELGHELIEAPPPEFDGPTLSTGFFAISAAALTEVAATMKGMLGRPVGPEDFEPFTLSLIDWYRGLPSDTFSRAMVSFEDAGHRMRSYLDGYDVVLCPTVPVAPFALGTLSPELDRETLIRRTEKLAGYTPIHNIAGVPAMSVPLFTASAGWPIGSHFAARRGEEATLLGLAYQLEQAAPWRDRWPSISAT
ncbi:amidase [Hyalangium rubrum]|uniref:Amidase family protein n=1 Tax=Hyalangium rubrum TaxID=3103134 RepID=A0ABU5HJR6_9BACT|nr:amidase family protein [Hyalangium sp. s54d21]MDY7233144.1 amidase family protein [Hyalangium sp. s54d21]